MIPPEMSFNQFQLSFQTQNDQESGEEATSPEESQPKGFSRQDYNRQYYQAHKQRICQKRKGPSGMKVLQLFSKDSAAELSYSQISIGLLRKLELLVFVVLSIIMTQYLIRESAVFYLEAKESLLSAYSKALMVEGTGILFSFSRGNGFILRWSQKFVMILLCGLTLFTMSGKLFRSATHDSVSYRLTAQMIKDLEVEQTQKDQLRLKFINREWIGAARNYDKDLVQVRQSLVEARKKLEQMESPDVTMSGLGILIIFRLLVVAANLICIHRVVELFTNETPRKETILAHSGSNNG